MNIKTLSIGVLFFSGLGGVMMAQKVKKDSIKDIEEVVLVGYGKQKKSDVTGSVTSIKASGLQDKPVPSVEVALQGKAPGVQIVNTGGRAGDNTQISIRGNGSLGASNEPLYIIDGVPQGSLGNLTPEDISSVEILKDAASSAIYGSRASNGVVLVETKSGKYNSRSRVSFTTSYGIQEIIKRYKVLNAAQYRLIHEVSRQNYLNDIAAGILGNPKDPNVLNPMPATKYDTNWLNYVLQPGVITNNQLSFTTGSDKTKVYLSASNVSQEGIIKQDKYEVSRIRFNVEQKIANNFRIGLNSYFRYSSSVPIADDNDSYQPFGAALEAPPTVYPYDDEGKLNNFSFMNPLFAFERKVSSRLQNVGSNFYAIYTPVKDLILKTSISGNISSSRYNRFDAPNTRRGKKEGVTPWGYGYYSTSNNRDYLIENTATYSTAFVDNKFKIDALLGQSFQRWEDEDSYVAGENFPSDDLRWLVSAGIINQGRSFYSAIALASFFSRLQLSWDNKYHLMLSTRYDGSSKFPKGHKWGNFPALSAGWTVSNESFFNVPFINTFKLRGSYGFTGNQGGISYASGLNLIGAGENYNQNPGLAVGYLFNPDLTWEKGKSIDAGVDLSMFNNRVNIVFDYYNKTTNNLLLSLPVTQESGFRAISSNAGAIDNTGYEVSIDTRIINGEKFKWNFGANFSYNKNIIKKIATDKGYYTTGFATIVKEGESLGSFYLLEAQGIAKERYEYKNAAGEVTKVVQPGDMIYTDVNGDGKINDLDRKVFSGGIAPIYGGLNTTFTYGVLDLSINAQYSVGKKIYAMYKETALSGASVGFPSFSANMIADQMDYWSPENPNASNPRPHMASEISSWNNIRSSRFLEKADYLRITDITLGFNLGLEETKFIKSMRIYAQVRNPFTFTNYSGIDPESQYTTTKVRAGVDYRGIPNVKVYSLGMNVNF